jgi:hypothetical protein
MDSEGEKFSCLEKLRSGQVGWLMVGAESCGLPPFVQIAHKGWGTLNRVSATTLAKQLNRVNDVEAVEVHHLVPRVYEVLNELRL